MQTPSMTMPFKVVALAPFRITDAVWARGPVAVDRQNPDQAVKEMDLSFYLPLPEKLCPAGGIELRLDRLKDFHPDRMIEKNEFLRRLKEAGDWLSEAKQDRLSQEEIRKGFEKWPDIPVPPVHLSKDSPASAPSGAVDNILDMVAIPGGPPDKPRGEPSGTVRPESMLQEVLSRIFENNAFRECESAWRGLQFLLRRAAAGESEVRFAVVPVTSDTLEENLDRILPEMIADLPSLVLVDLPLTHSPFCMQLLEKIAGFAETLMVPVITWITPQFLELMDWQGISKLPFIPHHLDKQIYAKFNRVRNLPAARWVAIACNRFMARYPYGRDNRTRLLRFEENGYLWASPVWALGSLILQSLVKTGWPTRFTRWREIRLEDLPLAAGADDTPLPTETAFSEDRMGQFKRAGIIPLAAAPGRDIVFAPVETMLGKASLAFQLVVSQAAQLIIRCRENLADDLEGAAAIEQKVKEIFSRFWKERGASLAFLSVSAGSAASGERVPLRIEFQPPPGVLPAGDNIVLDFVW